MRRSIFASFLLFVTLLVGVTSFNGKGTGIGIAVNGSSIVQLNVTGGIVCSPLGYPILGFSNTPLAGVNVTFSCNGGQTTLAQGVTNIMGLFQLNFTVSNLNQLNIKECRVIVPLPVNASCIYLSGSGSLQAPIRTMSISQTVAGTTVVNAVFDLFVMLTDGPGLA